MKIEICIVGIFVSSDTPGPAVISHSLLFVAESASSYKKKKSVDTWSESLNENQNLMPSIVPMSYWTWYQIRILSKLEIPVVWQNLDSRQTLVVSVECLLFLLYLFIGLF